MTFLARMLRRMGYERRSSGSVPSRTHFFDAYFARVPDDFFFVQIGASDGKLADPLYPYITKYGLAGIAVEPLPSAFAALTETYREHPQVKLVQAAVASESGRTKLYVPKGADLALSTLASLDPEALRTTLRQQQVPHEDEIEELEVEAVSFEELMRREGVGCVHMLQIDCEGYDWEILKTIDLKKWKPEVVNFESILLSPADRSASRAWLTEHGYTWFEAGYDTCAYRFP